VTGYDLPANLAKELSPTQGENTRAVIRIVFTGENANAPIISRLSRTFNIDVNIFAGQVDQIGEAPFGNIVVAIPAGENVVKDALDFVRAHGQKAEVLGYVA
jgi:D-methionine transport system ATP-binding protein